MKHLKFYLFFILIVLLCGQVAFADKVTLTTYIPAPFAAYKRLKLTPLAGEPFSCDDTQNGAMYYDNTLNEILVCTSSNSWETLSPWIEDGNAIYPKSTSDNPQLRVGLGITNPRHLLHVKDGNFYVEGEDYYSDTLWGGGNAPDPLPAPITPNIPDIGPTTHMIYYPPLGIFRSGVFSTEGAWHSTSNPTADLATRMNPDNWGIWSIGMGVNTRAEGWKSIAIGEYAMATNISDPSKIGGIAIGKESFANIASVAIGGLQASASNHSYTIGSQSTGNDESVIIGNESYADRSSTVIGHSNGTVGNPIEYSTVLGYGNNVAYGTVIGSNNVYDGGNNTTSDSIIIGTNSRINQTGNEKVSIGLSNFVQGNKSIIIGNGAFANGFNSISIGQTTGSYNYETVGIGFTALAGEASQNNRSAFSQTDYDDFRGSVALGINATAKRTGSIAMGNNVRAFAKYSVALGRNAVAGIASGPNKGDGENTFSFGDEMTVTGENSIGISISNRDTYTVSQDNTMAIVGRSNMRMGIDERQPQATLHINGQLGMGNDGASCASSLGGFYYDSSTNFMYYCDQSGAWKKIAPRTLLPSSIRRGGRTRGNAGGYEGLQAQCNANEHVCTDVEITRYLQENGRSSSGWIITQDVDDDCSGFTSVLGDGVIVQNDRLDTLRCSSNQNVLCCQY